MKKLIVILCAALTALALAACASGSPSASSAAKLTDFGWASFQVPDGYVKVNDLVQNVAISTSKDTDPVNLKLDDKTIRIVLKVREGAWPSAEEGLKLQLSKYPDTDPDLKELEIGGRTFYVTPFTVKEKDDSVMGYADVNDKRCIGFIAYYMDVDDPALATVLESLKIDESKMP